MPQSFFEQLLHSKDGSVAVAVIVGSLMRWMYKRNIKFWIVALNAVTMIVIMWYIAPAMAERYDLSVSSVTGIGMLAGTFGPDVIRGLFKLGDIFAKDPLALLPFRKK